MRYFYWFLFNFIQGPLSYLLLLIPHSLLTRNLQKRITFEYKSRSFKGCESFFNCAQQAEVCFEISSEGELEQVLPLIKELLQRDKKVELIFCSPSVEKKCINLYKENPSLLRILYLPLLTSFPHKKTIQNWMTAKKLVLCRYDFFPELMMIGLSPKIEFFLVSATLKNKSWFRSCLLFTGFNFIVAATELDMKKLKGIGYSSEKIRVFDFRSLQIGERQEKAEQTLSGLSSFTFLKEQIFTNISRDKRILLGSFWPKEASLFADPAFQDQIEKQNLHILIAPHSLGEKSLQDCLQELSKVLKPGIQVKHINSQIPYDDLLKIKDGPGVYLISDKGILCELYSFYGHVFVGGGHGRSIHSVLEPYLAGSFVYCGPRIHRSTEYDFVAQLSPDYIKIINQLNEFHGIYKENAVDIKKEDFEFNKRQELISMGKPFLGEFVNALSGIRAEAVK